MNARCGTLYLGMLTLAMSGCSQNSAPGSSDLLGPTQVATVNGEPIAESVLRVYALATVRKNVDEATPEEKSRLIEELIGVELLRQQAEKEGLAESRTVAAQIELQRLQLLARAMATSYLEKNPPTDSDLQAIYDENLPRLSGQQYKARHILTETREEADQVIADLRDGKDFAALAAERAAGPTGPNGGDLGWFTAESMPAPIVDAVRTMQAGAFSSSPVQTEFGYHVLLLEEVRAQTPPAMAEVRTELAAAAERKKLDEYLRQLRSEATVSLGAEAQSSSSSDTK